MKTVGVTRLVMAALVAATFALPRAESVEITGSVSGTVKDESGAVLPGVTVTVRGGRLPAEGQSVTSSPSGDYRVALLPPGAYSVEAKLPSFANQVRKSVEVAIDAETRVDFVLRPSGREESVDVVAEPPVVDTRRSEVSTRITETAIDALPLNGREFVDLVKLVPGATPATGGAPGGDLDQISIFGERTAALSFLVDGADNNNPLTGGPFVRYTQDSIQEFEVITTGYEAQFGRAQGGVTNIVTRSGSNDWQASAFLFARNDALDSSNIPDQDAPKLERYQWGGTVGGPVKRDKVFFFGAFEKLDETRGINFDLSKIPPFVASGAATPGGSEDFAIAPETNRWNGMLKLDVNLGPRQRLLVQGNRSDEDDSGEISSPVLGTTALPSAASTITDTANSGIVRHTAVLSASTFLESSVSYQKGRRGSNLDREGRFEPILILLASGFQQTGAPFNGKQDRTSKRFQLAQSFTWNPYGRGNHEIKAGWDFNDTGVKGFDDVLNDVEYSAAFLSPTAIADQRGPFRAAGLRPVRRPLLHHPARGRQDTGPRPQRQELRRLRAGHVEGGRWPDPEPRPALRQVEPLRRGRQQLRAARWARPGTWARRARRSCGPTGDASTTATSCWPRPRCRRRAGSSRAPPSTWPCPGSGPTTRTRSSTS